jgi:hypothetical protein
MTEQRFQDCLYILLQTIEVGHDENWDGDPIKNVRSFDDVGMATRNKGLVITLEDGSKFDLTISKSN